MGKWSIGGLKRKTKIALKTDYWRMIAVCFIMAIVCGMYMNSTMLIDDYSDIRSLFTGDYADEDYEQATESQSIDPYATPSATELLKEISRHYSAAFGNGNAEVGDNAAAVMNMVITKFFPNQALAIMVLRMLAMSGTRQAGITLFVFILFAAIGIFLDVFLFNMLKIGEKRFFMETRTYHDTKIYRLFYPYQVGRVGNCAWIMFMKNVFLGLWILTIIGGPIKYYEYKMIPYILAENPETDRRTCFKISKEMMRGNKWHAFLLDLSYIGWWFLGLMTFGLIQIFFVNPYETGAWTELYFELRGRYISDGRESSEKLCDIYLTERPSFVPVSTQRGLFGGVSRMASEFKVGAKNAASLLATGAKKVGSGVVADFTEAVNADKAALTREQANAMRAQIRAIGNEDVYPMAISPVQPTERAKKELFTPIRADRKYSFASYVLMFFLFSFVGWVWEVSLHLTQTGEFANRGVLLGPWLPIYGTGGIIVILFLRKWLHNPIITFLVISVTCVTVEYFTALGMWVIWHKKYWDYSTEFMNLQGRICLKGAIAFGLGGMAFMYLLAPRIDDWVIQKIPGKIRNILCAVLLALFGADCLHSAFHPNTGEGITSMLEQSPEDLIEKAGIYLKSRIHRM